MNRLSHRFESIVAAALFCVVIAGCRGDAQSPTRGPKNIDTARSSQLLVEDVIATLNALPDFVNLELTPPAVVLDARKSLDGKEILAVCGPNPDLPEGPGNFNNHLWVPAGNAGFRRNGVRPGDVVRYFAKAQQDFASENEDATGMGIVSFTYFEMPVAQVIGENRLLVQVPLNAPVETPTQLQVWRQVDDRMEEVNDIFQVYAKAAVPPLGWEPSPDDVSLEQVVQRLNQWMRMAGSKSDWKPDALVSTLPEDLLRSKALRPLISDEALAELVFEPYEGRWLQEAVWLRDISRWAHGDSVDDLGRAAALFDWTVRNIQITENTPGDPPREPWETLLFGRGAAAERAAVFALLGRQLGLDIAILSKPSVAAVDTNASDEENDADSGPLLAALLFEDDFYLFDPALGLPLFGPDGEGIATLTQLRDDETLLRRLDLDGLPYAWTADDLKKVQAGIVASPLSLARRAAILEAELVSDEAFVLTIDASAQAKRILETGKIDQVVLWDFPFYVLRSKLLLGPSGDPNSERERNKTRQRLIAVRDFAIFAAQPNLWKARVLQFQGRKETYVDHQHGGLVEQIDDHKDAMELYRQSRPPKRFLDQVQSAERKALLLVGKQNATYWAGLMALEDGAPHVAEDLLKRGTIEAYPDGMWTPGARYNLARIHEENGELDDAIALLEQDDSPQAHGNKLRAKRLRMSESAAP